MNIEDDALGSWSIDESLYDYIREVLPDGSTILELGSGYGTSWFAEHYTIYSVEHDPDFVDKYDSTYIHVPLKDHKPLANHQSTRWYDAAMLREGLEGLKYDLLLIDGPPQTRSGFFKYMELFDKDAIWVFDDLHREIDRKVVNSVASKLKCPYVVRGNGAGKPFGVINDPSLS